MTAPSFVPAVRAQADQPSAQHEASPPAAASSLRMMPVGQDLPDGAWLAEDYFGAMGEADRQRREGSA